MPRHPVAVLVLAVFLFPVAGFGASADPTVILIGNSGLDWREARTIVETFGGQIHHVLPPDAMVGEIPDVALEVLLRPPRDERGMDAWNPDALRFVRGADEARSALAGGETGVGGLSVQAKAALEFLLPRKATSAHDTRMLRVNPGGTVDVLPPREWETEPLVPHDRLPGYRVPRGIGNTWYHTSEYLCGDVAVSICRPESNGSSSGDGTNTENWTGAEVSYTYTELMKAMGQLITDAPRGHLTFVYKTEHVGAGVMGTVDCDYEAVNYANFNTMVVLNVLGKLGYAAATDWERMHEWVNAVRTAWKTDWAVGFFIVDESAAGAGTGRASAWLNGPTAWVFSTNDYKVYHHESGHSWGAWDEYASAGDSPTMFGGYTQDVNANSEFNDTTGFFSGAGEGINALMLSNVDTMSPWTRGALGIWDLDGDGVYEPLDVKPGVNIGAPVGPSWGPLQFSGVAWGGSLKVETGSFANSDITIGKIGSVEWRMNGGPWQPASAMDGAFDSSWEQYIFSTPPLRNWGFVFEVRAKDNFGNENTEYARCDYTATGSPLTNQGAVAAASVSPRYGSTGTTFTFDATASWDLEDGTTGLQYQWDFEDDGTWDAFTPVAAHSYPVPGMYTARIAVVDRMGHGMGRPVPNIQVAAADVPPVAAFTVDSGLKFAQPPGFPVLFNFDASRAWDGEDATASLQVRWDWQDDGVWDTAWATNKTVVKDYSWDYAAMPAQESGTSYFYAGNGVNGYAQSFLAQTPIAGKAELFLIHFNDLTPGGTVTAGLTAALPGPFLTSVTVNQSVLSEGDLNLFDFPDFPTAVGNMYYLVLISSDTDMMWLASLTNPYPGGQTFFSTNRGTSWASDTLNCGGTGTNCDHVFRIYDGNLGVVPLTRSKVWRVRLEVMDSGGQTDQYLHHVCANGYDHPPSVSLSAGATSGPWNAPFNLTATGSDPDFGFAWDGTVHYRWDVDGDGTYETEYLPGNTNTVMYARSGNYQATCEVRDRYHATARAVVTLSAAPIAGGMGLMDRNGTLPPGNTDEREVDASFAASGEPQEMILSENPSFAGASWQAYATQVVYKLSAGVGPKTLHAKFRSGAGNESGSVFANINYVPGAPPSLTVSKNGSDARLDWSTVPTGAFDCSVYRSSVADFSSYTEFTLSPTAATTLDHTGALVDGQLWLYKVETDPLP
jgi:hypothetical protein